MFEISKFMLSAFKYKKAQLGMIEAQYFFGGLVVGLIAGIVVVILAAKGVIPLSFLKTMACGAATKK